MNQRRLRGVGLISVWFSICFGVPGLATDQHEPAHAKSTFLSSRPRLQVFLYVYAPISDDHLKTAKEVATDIYGAVGVHVAWLECYLAGTELTFNPECSRLTATTIVVRILPRSQAERFKQPPWVFGFAQSDPSGGFGYYASIFYHRVEELSGTWTSSTPIVLGHVMAHEMGHLLLGHGGHARTGLMTANWDRKELERVNQRRLVFTSQQAKEIRARSLERHSSAEASRLSQVAEKGLVGDPLNEAESAGLKE